MDNSLSALKGQYTIITGSAFCLYGYGRQAGQRLGLLQDEKNSGSTLNRQETSSAVRLRLRFLSVQHVWQEVDYLCALCP